MQSSQNQASDENGPLARQLNCELRMRRECRERFPATAA